MRPVTLIFPPLVPANFGRAYPSLAVLAGWLGRCGIPCRQLDLNHAFLDHVLGPAVLAGVGSGRAPDGTTLAVRGPAAVAARCLQANRDAIFDRAGRQVNPAEGLSPLGILREFGRLYQLDPVAGDSVHDHPLAANYREFFGASRELAAVVRGACLVGVSVPMGPQLGPAILLARALMELDAGLRVVIGGPCVSLMDPASLSALLRSEPWIYAAVRMEGELPLTALALQAEAGEDHPETIPGVAVYRAGVARGAPPGRGLRLNDMPDAAWDEGIVARNAAPRLGILQARGCYWGRCAYCDYVELYDGSPAYRTRSVPRFVAELAAQAARHRLRDFEVVTEALPAPFARRLAEQVRERGLDVGWVSFAMVDDHYDSATFDALARGGCRGLAVGVETVVDHVLARVAKASREAGVLRFLRSARDAGVPLKINLIPDLPGTRRDEAMEALARLREHADCIERVGIFPFEATASSAIGRDPTAFGLEVLAGGQRGGQAEYAGNHLVVRDAAMSPEERAAVLAAYEAFSRELALREARRATAGRLGPGPVAPGDRLRFAGELVDLVDEDGACWGTNWLTHDAWRFPPAWRAALPVLRSGEAFTSGELVARFGSPGAGAAALEQLLDRWALARVPDGVDPGRLLVA